MEFTCLHCEHAGIKMQGMLERQATGEIRQDRTNEF